MKIVERNDLHFERWRNPLRDSRWIASLLAIVASLALTVVLVMRDDQRPFEARPVSMAHRFTEGKCVSCHDRAFGALARFVLWDDRHRSVSDVACQKCHQEDAHDHHPARHSKALIRDCVQCHIEHTGNEWIADIGDQQCIQCHGNLAKSVEGTPTPLGDFAPAISSFASHPDFAVHRAASAPELLKRLGLTELVTRSVSPNSEQRTLANPPAVKIEDQTRLQFNHRFHLNPHGVADASQVNRSQNNLSQGNGLTVLNCNDCHELASSGDYFQPIRFEQHCRRCHQLDYGRIVVGSGALFSEGIPHGAPDLVRGVLRDRLTRVGRMEPELVNPPAASDASKPPHKRNKSLHVQLSEWVEAKIPELEVQIFEPTGFLTDGTLPSDPDAQPGDAKSANRGGCARCHTIAKELRPESGSMVVHWKIDIGPEATAANSLTRSGTRAEPHLVPDRWLPHSRFRHDRHAQWACTSCHYKNASGAIAAEAYDETRRSKYPLAPMQSGPSTAENLATGGEADREFAAGEGSIFGSVSTKDILIPSMDSCRKCHDNTQTKFAASGKCITCHDFHHRPKYLTRPRRLADPVTSIQP